MKKSIPFTFNLLYYAAIASVLPFLTLYYQHLGFSGIQISVLAGVAPLVILIFSPFWTSIADITGKHKLIMSINLILAVACLGLFPFLQTFPLVLSILLVFTVFMAPLVSFADSATMTMLADEKRMYGRVRLGGTIGWGFGALVAGFLIKTYGLDMAFWACAGVMAFVLIISQGFNFGKHKADLIPRADFRSFFTNRHWIPFFALACIGGVGFSATSNYFSPYMKSLGGDEYIIGVALLVSTLSEIPVLFFGNRLIKWLKTDGLLVFALIIIGVRALLLAASGTPTMATLVQLLHGLTYPAMLIAGVAYADEHAPENLKSTAQALFGAMAFGIGSAFGGFMGGILLDTIGGRAMFLVYGVAILVGVAFISSLKKRLSNRYAQV